MKNFAEMKSKDILKELGSSSAGITEGEVANRLKEYGYNELKEKRTTIALMPGSRQQEVDRHLPIMIDTIRLLSYEGLDIYWQQLNQFDLRLKYQESYL